ncbi:hypothetical protein C0649_01610 [Enterococcus faecium]|nr:hypothetical protein [Enterococcus faecium]MSS53388.1 hypothetical protein [Enterococcus sp. WCA-130-P53-23F]MSS65618.1 hypothetical protein [Enterococcus sp. BSM-130-P53-22D]RAX32324.1 hypothetical protein DQE80_00695 [Enterococcus sp. HPCN18]EGP5233619.1 hypothetical protein [Enterococcus faecium]
MGRQFSLLHAFLLFLCCAYFAYCDSKKFLSIEQFFGFLLYILTSMLFHVSTLTASFGTLAQEFLHYPEPSR